MDSNHLFTFDRLSDFVKNYKEYVYKIEKEESNPSSENYKYYHFEDSPEGVIISNIGRFGRDVFSNVSSWKEISFTNGIDAWRMNLAKLYNKYKKDEIEKFNSTRKSGLKFILNKSKDPKLTLPRVLPNIDTTNLSYNITIENDTSKIGVIEDFTGFKTMLAQLLKDVQTNAENPTADTELISLDFTGLIYLKPGNYKFISNGENCDFYVWIGDDSVCEYYSSNSDINNNNNSISNYYANECYVPIRIQCYFSSEVKDVVDLSFSIVEEKMVDNQLTTRNITAESMYNTEDPILLIYSAFVSENNQDFLNDRFKCYSMFDIQNNKIMVDDFSQLSLFYKSFKKNLNDVLNNRYDYNEDNRLSYGVIPSINIEYSIVNKQMNPAPFCYSIYKIKGDFRMGKTYQIKNKADDNGTFYMNQFSDKLSDSILEYSNSYREKSGYYPNKTSVDNQYFSKEQDLTGVECKELCNDDPNCRYYFTYTSNKSPKCVINSDNSLPYYNRIPPSNTEHPIDENSSSVFLRNYQLDVSGSLNCGTFRNINKINDIKNTTNFSDTFKYAKYAIDNKQIIEPTKLGICGDPVFIKHQNDAKKILYDDAKYFNDGSWKTKEGFTDKKNKSKVTHAISDTGDAIRNNLKSERKYSKKMMGINKKYDKLQKDIPGYMRLRNEMTDEPKYDFKGDELLHFRTKLIPDVRKKKIIDNNDLYVNSQLLFALGTVTTATLIVFAILLAKE